MKIVVLACKIDGYFFILLETHRTYMYFKLVSRSAIVVNEFGLKTIRNMIYLDRNFTYQNIEAGILLVITPSPGEVISKLIVFNRPAFPLKHVSAFEPIFAKMIVEK